ncbi:DEBR0S4_05512g1_1 [Brettanomyces bruxellensis]|uniref:DEBR0S4_05512g1_1 n=1 Tax=Dekkera bruxellensis TaxID=5007 RepID=A0A7D9D056_DEKBR|nr:DEBR0S4_05512g1_1 [Brettanomyces bruxellensis]
MSTNRTGAGYPLADSRSAVSGLSKEECGSNFTGDDKLSVAASVKSIKSGRTANIGARMSEISSLMSNSEPSGFSDTFSNKPLYSVQPSELDVDRVGSSEDDNYDRVSDYRSFGPAPSEYTAESVIQQQSAANSDSLKAPAVPRKFAQDAASMVTLASSIKSRRRRRSIDTNASTTAIAPASILERIAGSTSPAAGSLNGRSMSGAGSIGGNLSANGAEQESHSSVSIKS